MDPNETLRELRTAVALYVASMADESARTAAAEAMADSFEALDTWLCNQGFLPDEWERGRR